MPQFNRLLITGAAGNLGRELRRGLAPLAASLRLTDRSEMAPPQAHEETLTCELGDFDAVMDVVEGCDAIVHFGAAPVERPWAEILESSIKGGYNVYEAARRHGVKRIVYASSIHAVGYERRETGADTDTPHNPNSLTASPSVSSKSWQRCISTSSASSRPACASTPVIRSRPIGAISPPG